MNLIPINPPEMTATLTQTDPAHLPAAKMGAQFPNIPAAFFGMVLGLAGVSVAAAAALAAETKFCTKLLGLYFGVAALTTAPLRMIANGQTGPMTEIAPALFVIANVDIGIILLGSIRLALQGRLLPR